jgi:NAD(P)-dependent dehydrogenase (short-subunit alcohol dehydrogenase family)
MRRRLKTVNAASRNSTAAATVHVNGCGVSQPASAHTANYNQPRLPEDQLATSVTHTPSGLADRVIVVIGGTSGIGLSGVRALVSAGARVVALGLRGSGAEAAAICGTSGAVVEGDATDRAVVDSAIDAAVRIHGRLDGLYHVAGGSGRRFGDGPLHEITDEGWRATLDLNLTSVFLSNRAATRRFLEQEQGGAIVNLTSVLAYAPAATHFSTHAYAAAKAAIIGLTRASAARYAAQGIRFNAIAPGLVETPMARRAANDPEIVAFVRRRQPLDHGRLGRSDDVDGAAVFLLSDASRFVTGQVIGVDGGWSVS